jgi:TetR/AcrR family transcriptional regulator, transcriptional repressor for nem operon
VKHFSEITVSAVRVVDAAEQLVQHLGYNGFSYDDIAKKIGIRKPSIHHHFPTKAELVATVAQRYTYRFSERLLKIELTEGAAINRLMMYAGLFQDTYIRDRCLCVCGMLAAESEGLPENVSSEVKSFFKTNIQWLSKVIAEGRKTPEQRSNASTEAAASIFICALEGAMVVGRGLESDDGPKAIAKLLAPLLLS